MKPIAYCLLTGIPLDENAKVDEQPTGTFYSYQFNPVGKVKMGIGIYTTIQNSRQFKHPVLAGICRNAFEKGEEPPLINQNFIDNDIKNLNIPRSFKEKCRHLLKFIYDKGGKDFKPVSFFNQYDYTLCYSEDIDEFDRVMNYLYENVFLNWEEVFGYAGNLKNYQNVLLTDPGIDEVEKELPKVPMIGLVSQEITTGNPDVDEKINHAKTLFFQEPQTIDRMRSACEALSYVLEPLRKDLSNYFSAKDISDFFQIVNEFDIRHNKDTTKAIIHAEQLEWVFYSLLNTVNTYTKLKRKLDN